jgi:hypothetical protein
MQKGFAGIFFIIILGLISAYFLYMGLMKKNDDDASELPFIENTSTVTVSTSITETQHNNNSGGSGSTSTPTSQIKAPTKGIQYTISPTSSFTNPSHPTSAPVATATPGKGKGGGGGNNPPQVGG